MEVISKKIRENLDEFSNDYHLLARFLEDQNRLHGKAAFCAVFQVFSHLDLLPDVAETCWKEVLAHGQWLSEHLGRRPSLQTVICDYFSSIKKVLKNPVVIEIKIFERASRYSKYDALTGLFTRGFFEETMQREMARASRHVSELSLLYFDLDDFKNVNDTFGHMAGDKVLKATARCIMNGIRTEDLAARYGGEEIVVVLPETGKAKGLAMGERIRNSLESQKIQYDNQDIPVTISGGLASYPIDGDTTESLLKKADMALYRAKGSGKNCVVPYSQEKRRYMRMDFISKIMVRELGFDDPANALGTARNLSLAGILFAVDKPFDINRKVEVSFTLNGCETCFSAVGIVVRVEYFQNRGYEIGVSFMEEDRQHLNSFFSQMKYNGSNILNIS